MRCNKCDKEAVHIVDGQSVCIDHKGNDESLELMPKDESAGQRMSGM